MKEWLIGEVKLAVAIIAELGLGFLFWLLTLGLLPKDTVDFNVVGSLVVMALIAVPYWAARGYVKAHQNS